MKKIYTCKYCGQEFDNRYKMIGHITLCIKNPNYEQNKIKCNNLIGHKINILHKDKIVNCQYCGRECKVYGLKNHEKYCEQNPNRQNYPIESHLGIDAWNKGLTSVTDTRIAKYGKTYKEKYAEGKIKAPWKGKILPEEMKDKIRISKTEQLKEIIDWGSARISKTACKYMDKLNEEKHWNLQHGMNGGEITCIGYFLDGYDKDLNIVFEYDEPRHYIDVTNNILCEKDIIRQNKIINKLHCEFWRYNEKMNLLYKVN